MKLITKRLSEIVPYGQNPRINDAAVPELIKSIEQCGYVAPIIIDEDGVILAGHTRHKALLKMGREEAECLVVPGLTEEQKRKFRILDNKTGEVAEWDIDLLTGELENLDLGDVHWFDDLLNPNVKDMQPKADRKNATGADADDGAVYCPKCGALVDDGNGPVEYEDSDDELPFA